MDRNKKLEAMNLASFFANNNFIGKCSYVVFTLNDVRSDSKFTRLSKVIKPAHKNSK